MNMVINGTDIYSIFGDKVEFLNYELAQPSYTRLVTVTDYDRKIVNKRDSVGIHNMAVTVVMRETKENCYIMASKLASLLGESYVNFGGGLTYKVTIAVDGIFENLAPNLFKYTMQLQILEKRGALVTVTTTDSSVPLSNVGTYKTPIRIEMTPTTTTNISLYGFGAHTVDNPLVITNVVANKKLILDGSLCMLLQEVTGGYINKFNDSNLMSFPEIAVGSNTLVFTPTGLAKTITYYPKYI